MDNNETVEALEVLQPSALHALERAQIDTQVATAHQYPRQLAQFRTRALGMATLDEDTAESCIYCRPVGKEKDDKGVWRDKIVEGPSIRLAEIVGCSYGNLRVATRIIEMTPRYVKVEGVCHDLESNYAGKAEVMESTVTKDGNPYSERQRALVAKAASAKAYRDAIFKVVPRALCKPILEAAKKVAAGGSQPLEVRIKKAKVWVNNLKIDNAEARVFNVLGVDSWQAVTAEVLVRVSGLRTALSEGEPIEEVIPPLEGSASPGIRKPEMPGQAPAPTQPAATQPAAPKPKPQPVKKPAPAAPVTPPQPPANVTPMPPPETVTPEAPEDGDLGPQTVAEPETTPAETTPEQAEAPEAQPEAPTAAAPAPEQPAAPPTAPFVPNPALSMALNNVFYLLHKHGKTEAQLVAVLKGNKAMKPEQAHVSELSEAKLENVSKAWASLLQQIQQNEPRR